MTVFKSSRKCKYSEINQGGTNWSTWVHCSILTKKCQDRLDKFNAISNFKCEHYYENLPRNRRGLEVDSNMHYSPGFLQGAGRPHVGTSAAYVLFKYNLVSCKQNTVLYEEDYSSYFSLFC